MARRRTPTILQMEAVECGAAALAIVLAHHGRWLPLEELRLACGVSRDGSKASNIVRAARGYGLIPQGTKKKPEDLRQLPCPAILHWNFNHFVVLEGIDGDHVAINDPASGPRSVSWQELDAAFTGVAITFKPGPAFERSGRKPALIPALRRRLGGSAPALLFLVLAGLLLVLPFLWLPAFTRLFVDDVLLDGREDWLRPLLLAMAASAAMIAALSHLQQRYLLRLENRLAVADSGRFLWHVLRLPAVFFTQRFAGDVSSRVAANEQVAQLLARDVAGNVLALLSALFFAAVLFSYDPLLAGVCLAVLSLNALVVWTVARRRIDGSRRLAQDRGKMLGTALGGLHNIETIKASGAESDLFARWAGHQAKVVNARQELEQLTQSLDAIPPLLTALSTALVLGVGGWQVMAGALTLGELLGFQVLLASLTLPVQQLVTLVGRWQKAEGDLARLDDVLRYPADAQRAAESGPVAPDQPFKLAGKVELRGVTFGYSRLDPPLIENFDLVLAPGARVALIGGSGSGKTTLVHLLTGLYQPWAGEILFDGRPRAAIPPAVLAASLAAVDQSIVLFEGSVRDNLTLWDGTLPLPEVIEAARDAAIHEVVAARPGGYDSPVHEGGTNFSGGQRQRLEIARALVGRPSIVILDEATSALDAETEHEIDQNLRRRGCTCLIVAHRLSTIRDADEILVLDGGKVVQRGRHEELIQAADGLYARLMAHE
jgi:NHLM bacteriocin system ABC transporter peptidase/ATP-binding protein